MNAKPNVSDWQHAENRKALVRHQTDGWSVVYGSQGYRVEHDGAFIAAAGTLKRPNGRYREANTRDNLACALVVIARHALNL